MSYLDPKNSILLNCNVSSTSEICLHIPPIVSENINKSTSATTLLARTMELHPRHLMGKIDIGIMFKQNIWFSISWTSWPDFVNKANNVWKSYFPAAQPFIQQQETSWSFALLTDQIFITDWASLLNPQIDAASTTSPDYLNKLQKSIKSKPAIGNPSQLELSLFAEKKGLTGLVALKPNPLLIVNSTPVLKPGSSSFMIVNPESFLQIIEFQLLNEPKNPAFNYLHISDPYNKIFARFLIRGIQDFVSSNTLVTQHYNEAINIQVKDGALLLEKDCPWTSRISYSLAFTGFFHRLYIPDHVQMCPLPGQFMDSQDWVKILLRLGASPLSFSMTNVLLLSGEPTQRATQSFYTPPFSLEVLSGTGKSKNFIIFSIHS